MILGLETLRGLAALVVAFYHYPGGSILWVPQGFMAVYLFFSLSGFVIALNYFNKIDNLRSLVSFQKKRFFRLYPVHIFVLILILLIQCLKFVAIELGLPAGQEAFGGHPSTGSWYTLRDFISHIFLLQAVSTHGYHLSWNSAAWTISTEFYTYFTFAILVLISFRKPYIFIFLSIIYINFSGTTFKFVHSIFGFRIFTYLFQECIMYFLSGCLVFFIYERIKYRFNDYIFYIFLIPCLYFKEYLPNHILFSIVILLVALLKKNTISNIILSYKPLVYLGTISYSFYMIHQVVLYLFIQVLKVFNLGVSFSGKSSGGTESIFFDTLITISYVAISIIIAIFMHKFIEKKFRIKI